MCVLILLHMCPHTNTYVSSYYYMCVLILLRMCPHATTCVSTYYYICVLILLSYDYDRTSQWQHTHTHTHTHFSIGGAIMSHCSGMRGRHMRSTCRERERESSMRTHRERGHKEGERSRSQKHAVDTQTCGRYTRTVTHLHKEC
jgi:hypothetical protein